MAPSSAQRTAGYVNHLPGHVTGVPAGQEGDGVSDVRHLSDQAAHGGTMAPQAGAMA
jgi:hypothetical protein